MKGLMRGGGLLVLSVAVWFSATSGGAQAGLSAGAAPGREVVAPDGRALQRALDEARGGETILLDPGAVYEGPFILPARAATSDEWVTVQTRGPIAVRRGGVARRAGPLDAERMARLISHTGSVIVAEPGAHHYRFVGLEVAPAPGVFLFDLIDLGSGVASREDLPHSFVFERMLIRGDPDAGARRGIALNGGETTITDSHFSDFKEEGRDSQAICGWNGPGPYVIHNNYIEAAGENIMFGGADSAIEGMVPSDITITANHLSKPLGWRNSDGPDWTVKNLLELKNARRVVIDGNVLEHSWPAGQTGFAVLLTPRNQDGGSPWSVVEDVTFSNNLVRRVGGGIHLLGFDDNQSSQQLARVRIVNNLFVEVGGEWGGGRLFQIINGTSGVVIEHNTAFQTGPAVIADEAPHDGFVFRGNIVAHNEYGIIGSGASPGWDSIRRYFPDGIVERNVLIGGNSSIYPSGNFFPRSLQDVQFMDAAAGDYRLARRSPFRGEGIDGRNPGADVDQVATGLRSGARPGMPLERGALLIFLTAGGLLAYVYVGYPGILWLASRLRSRPVHASPRWPTISIVVVAHNEEARIVRKVENLLSLDYPPERREIIVASDGSTDATAERVREMGGRVRVMEFRTRRGKAAVFNTVLPSLSSEIVVLTDSRQRFERSALRAMTADFADPVVGAVTGELVLVEANGRTDGESTGEGSGLYWRYEKWIRAHESRVDSCIGVTGAISALRRSLFEPLPEDTILDDVLIPLRIIRRGYRVTFESGAVAYDGYAASPHDEFTRKVRTLAGNFQLFVRERWLLNPFRNPLWIQTISHKVLRLSIPLLLLAALASNLLLLAQPVFQVTLVLQGLFYLMALAGALAPRLRHRVRGFTVPFTICFLSWATVVAFIRFVQHRQSSAWDRTAVNEPV